MKKLVMICCEDFRLVQGVNFVIDNMVKSKGKFVDLSLEKVYGGKMSINVSEGENMPIGCNIGTKSYRTRRSIRLTLKKFVSYDFYIFAKLRYYLDGIRPAQKAVRDYLASGEIADYLLFHDMLTAYYFFKYKDIVTEKCAIVVHEATDDMDQMFSILTGLARYEKKKILQRRDYVYNKIDKVVYISKSAYENSKMPASKKCVIYNGINDIAYNFNDDRRDVVNLVSVGGINGRKGQDFIIEALVTIPNTILDRIHLTLVGDGIERERLEEMVRSYSLGKAVTFTGARDDVPEILRDQDVFIMPSENEGLSIATIEGIRAGLFMLLTDTGGNKEVMGEDGGYVIKRDVNDIKEKICKIVENNIISKEQKERSRRHFLEYFTTDIFMSSYEKMFRSL